jgi:hypothetical protein
MDEPDSAFEQHQVHVSRPHVASHILQPVPTRQMKAFRFPVGGHDHANRNSILLPRPDFTNADRDVLLPSSNRTIHNMPVPHNFNRQRAFIQHLSHVNRRFVSP